MLLWSNRLFYGYSKSTLPKPHSTLWLAVAALGLLLPLYCRPSAASMPLRRVIYS